LNCSDFSTHQKSLDVTVTWIGRNQVVIVRYPSHWILNSHPGKQQNEVVVSGLSSFVRLGLVRVRADVVLHPISNTWSPVIQRVLTAIT
jgi:hypothetical protein